MKLTTICLWICAACCLWTAFDVYMVNRELQYILTGDHLEKCENADLWPKVVEGLVEKSVEDEQFRAVIVASGVGFVDGAIEAVGQDVFLDNFTATGKTFLPQDVGYWFELVFSANYSSTASVISAWTHRMWLAVNEHKNFDNDEGDDYDWWDDYDYDSPADYWETISQAAHIVAKTKFLSDSPVQTDGSAVGNIFSALPNQIQQTLGDTQTQAAFANDCVALAVRFNEADYKFCYIGDYGRQQCRNYNSNVGQITSVISKVCSVLKDSTVY